MYSEVALRLINPYLELEWDPSFTEAPVVVAASAAAATAQPSTTITMMAVAGAWPLNTTTRRPARPSAVHSLKASTGFHFLVIPTEEWAVVIIHMAVAAGFLFMTRIKFGKPVCDSVPQASRVAATTATAKRVRRHCLC